MFTPNQQLNICSFFNIFEAVTVVKATGVVFTITGRSMPFHLPRYLIREQKRAVSGVTGCHAAPSHSPAIGWQGCGS